MGVQVLFGSIAWKRSDTVRLAKNDTAESGSIPHRLQSMASSLTRLHGTVPFRNQSCERASDRVGVVVCEPRSSRRSGRADRERFHRSRTARPSRRSIRTTPGPAGCTRRRSFAKRAQPAGPGEPCGRAAAQPMCRSVTPGTDRDPSPTPAPPEGATPAGREADGREPPTALTASCRAVGVAWARDVLVPCPHGCTDRGQHHRTEMSETRPSLEVSRVQSTSTNLSHGPGHPGPDRVGSASLSDPVGPPPRPERTSGEPAYDMCGRPDVRPSSLNSVLRATAPRSHGLRAPWRPTRPSPPVRPAAGRRSRPVAHPTRRGERPSPHDSKSPNGPARRSW